MPQTKQNNMAASPLEMLRLERTTLTQDELAFRCGIPRATYQRWITGKTLVRLSLAQLKVLCRELRIARIDELPDDFVSAENESLS